MWSLGCVLYEMYTGQMLFDPSKMAQPPEATPAECKPEDLKAMLDDELFLLMVDLLGCDALAINDPTTISISEEVENEEAQTGKEKGKGKGKGKEKGKQQKKKTQKTKSNSNNKTNKKKGETESKKGGGESSGGSNMARKAKKRKRDNKQLKVNERGELFFNSAAHNTTTTNKKKRKLEEGEGWPVRPVAAKGASTGFVRRQGVWHREEEVPLGEASFLSFKKGDIVHILEKADESYWKCQFAGRTGLVSVADLELQSPCPHNLLSTSTTLSTPDTEDGGERASVRQKRLELDAEYRRSQYIHTHRKMMTSLSTDDHLFVDLLQRLLDYDPMRRLSPQEALLHPFFASFFPFMPVFTNIDYNLSFASLREFSWQDKRGESGVEEFVLRKGVKKEEDAVGGECQKRKGKKTKGGDETKDWETKLKHEKGKLKKKKKKQLQEKLQEMDRKMTLTRISMKEVFDKDLALQLETQKERLEKQTKREISVLQKEIQQLKETGKVSTIMAGGGKKEGVTSAKPIPQQQDSQKLVRAAKTKLKKTKKKQLKELKAQLLREGEAALHASNTVAQQTQQKLKDQMESLRADVQREAEGRQVAEATRKQLERQKGALEDDVRLIQRQQREAEAKNQSLAESLKGLEASMEGLTKRHEEKMGALRVELTQAGDTRVQQERKKWEEMVAEEKQKTQKLKDQWNAKTKSLEDRIAGLSGTLVDKNKEVEELQDDVARLEGERKKMAQQLSQEINRSVNELITKIVSNPK